MFETETFKIEQILCHAVGFGLLEQRAHGLGQWRRVVLLVEVVEVDVVGLEPGQACVTLFDDVPPGVYALTIQAMGRLRVDVEALVYSAGTPLEIRAVLLEQPLGYRPSPLELLPEEAVLVPYEAGAPLPRHLLAGYALACCAAAAAGCTYTYAMFSVALGAQDLFKNLIGGITVLAEKRFNEKLSSIQHYFKPHEAEVYKKQNQVIIRLKTMHFPVGQSVIMPDNYGLLSKVQRAIRTFGEPDVIIGGHTDSTGSEEINEHLSQQRADAVRQYFVANETLPYEKIIAVGYGSMRPIASNATESGRAMNRRIDVIITPEAKQVQ